MTKCQISKIVVQMATVDSRFSYYALTMIVSDDGKSVIGTQTQWTRWADVDRMTELRAPSLVRPEAMIAYWNHVGQSYVVVKDDRSWFIYFQIGGNALV